MKYYAVIDTNVLVSALLKEGSIPSLILDYIIEEKIIPVYDDDIIAEYEEVLVRNKFGFSPFKVKMVISLIAKLGLKIDPIEINEFLKDKDDVKFFQVVMSSRRYNESYLVTGNKKDFPIKYFVVSPVEMAEIINDTTAIFK